MNAPQSTKQSLIVPNNNDVVVPNVKKGVSPAKLPQSIAIPPKSFEERMKHFNEDFIMPSMPSGQRLHFNIHSTWGDVNYVGLTGIELFDSEGQ